MEKTLLSMGDYVVIGATLLISSGIGIYYRLTGGKQKTEEEYFLADRSMSIFPVAIGLMASFFSAVSILGVSSEIYVHGTQFVAINLAYGFGTWFAAHLYLPVFFKLKAASSFEYLEKRFGVPTKLLASFGSLVQLLLYTSIALYAPALALEATTGIPLTTSVVGIALVCTFYSTIGGIKAVLITDVFQSVLMFASVIVVIATAAVQVGGLDKIWEIAQKGHRLEFDNISIDPTVRQTWWSLFWGGFFTYLSLYGVNQIQVQRLLTIRKLESAQKALWWSWPVISALSFTTCLSGLSMYSKYWSCDPRMSGRIKTNDQLMPLYVMDTLSNLPGLPGLFIAGIFSAGLSTISATLNSLAAVILEDYVKPVCKFKGIELSLRCTSIISKCLAMTMGIACLAVAALAGFVNGILEAALSILGIVGGPMLGLFSLGMLTETANQEGAIFGFLTSLAFSFWLGFGGPKPRVAVLPVSIDGCNATDTFPLTSLVLNQTLVNLHKSGQSDDSYIYMYRISYLWYCPLGFAVCFLSGMIVSWAVRIIFKEPLIGVDPDLLTPLLASRVRRRQNKYSRTKETDNVQSVPC